MCRPTQCSISLDRLPLHHPRLGGVILSLFSISLLRCVRVFSGLGLPQISTLVSLICATMNGMQMSSRCVEAHYWENNVDCCILNTRAWAFQEMLLVPRTLVLLSDQIFWQCEPLLASEIDPIGMHDEYPEYTDFNWRQVPLLGVAVVGLISSRVMRRDD